MVLCFTTLQIYFIQHNLHFGLFWFLYPCLLVLVNDTTAYLFGHWLGQHSLLNLSPKKTLEGYVMAMICTILFGYWLCAWLKPLDKSQQPNLELHGMILSIYASTTAPFGGFLASAIKRAGGVKDFGQFIPGHGGITDRVDCQLLMAAFTFFYCEYMLK
ncbi:hypothetical protein G6F22_011910 [Rhizopus arrhizus]|nr:hypothetical protein G6F22_011910 [Rhizopus arrhizus]KAG0844983.1 hypothetical protein G6F18_001397 [Rhizopus arrhizus]KAG1167922.1 hypothetical protein G6F36_012392 [Rhizopus arrhizus]KAG1380809.1 hypothetical protein G6F61_003730 [Rhizopus arrhizus]